MANSQNGVLRCANIVRMMKCIIGLACCVALLTSICSGDKQQGEASVLIAHATELSDIRSKNAPAFRLKADLTSYDKDGAQKGTYLEYWLSGGQWRHETTTGSFHRIEAANGNKRWSLDNTSDTSANVNVPLLNPAPWNFDLEGWRKGKIEEKSLRGLALRCIMKDFTYYPKALKAALCFDKTTGTLAATVQPFDSFHIADQTCEYSDYQKFGEKTFPRDIRCFDGGKPKSEIRVVELAAAENLSADLFLPLEGGKESFNCAGTMKLPRPLHTPDPRPPRMKNPDHPVVLKVLLGKNGKPRDISVVRSIDKDFDDAARSAVRWWKFEPASCDGEVIETEITVEVEFSILGAGR